MITALNLKATVLAFRLPKKQSRREDNSNSIKTMKPKGNM
jgi:hypothetical protein